jgi:polysaccharide biosynthesis protein PelG
LCALFAGTNTLLTLVTLHLGPTYYGYGFALSATVSVLVGLAVLSRKLERLEYETFMLQQAAI